MPGIEAKPNQGMRQPQLGGIGSIATRRTMNVCKHTDGVWRLGDGHKWICGVCHPPAVGGVEWIRAPAPAL